jgi:hypothetical protein
MASNLQLPVHDLGGSIIATSDNNYVNNSNNQNNANMVSLQSLLQQSGIMQVSAAEASLLQKQPIKVTSSYAGTTTSTSIPVQLSIPGLSAPVTLSVNLPDGSHQGQQQVSKAGTLVTSMGKIMTTHASMGGPQTVFLQGAGGNLIPLPQQAVSSAGTLSHNVIKPLMTSGHQIQLQPNQLITSGGHLLQVRQASGSNGPQQVFLQMPGNNSGQTISAVTSCGQPFQIVRSVQQPTIVRPQQPSPQHQQQQQQHILLNSMNSLKSPPGGGNIPPSPNSVTSPRQPQLTPPMQQQQQLLMSNPESNNLVAIQLQNSSDNPGQSQQILLATHGGGGSGVGGPINHLTQAAQLRVRQQRKQSLK